MCRLGCWGSFLFSTPAGSSCWYLHSCIFHSSFFSFHFTFCTSTFPAHRMMMMLLMLIQLTCWSTAVPAFMNVRLDVGTMTMADVSSVKDLVLKVSFFHTSIHTHAHVGYDIVPDCVSDTCYMIAPTANKLRGAANFKNQYWPQRLCTPPKGTVKITEVSLWNWKRCVNFRLKCTKSIWRLGFAQTRWLGDLTALPWPSSWI